MPLARSFAGCRQKISSFEVINICKGWQGHRFQVLKLCLQRPPKKLLCRMPPYEICLLQEHSVYGLRHQVMTSAQNCPRTAISWASVSSKNKPGFATEISKWILGHLWLRWRGISLVDYDEEND